jgi:LysM repeat protein
MARSPRTYYPLFSLILILTLLTGCELSRGGAASDMEVAGEPSRTPTLASLGADSGDLAVEATPIPTVINVEPTATMALLGEGQAAENPDEPVAPTSQPVDPGITPPANDQAEGVSVTIEGAPTAESVSPETFVPPAQGQTEAEAPIIVDATSEQLPDGGPIAANPPASQAGGDVAIYGDGTTHLVQPGDTLFSLSVRYGTTVEAFMRANGLTSEMIYQGQTLVIPTDEGSYSPPAYGPAPPGSENYHMVAAGETLFSIAQSYGSSVGAIAEANGITYPYLIYVGQYLTIPAYGNNPAPSPPSTEGGYYPPPPPADGGYYSPPTQGGYYPPPAEGGYYPPQNPAYSPPAEGYYPPQQGTYPPAPGMTGTHTVGPGETLYSIATRYGTTAQAIAQANGITNPNQIYVGQVLYLP